MRGLTFVFLAVALAAPDSQAQWGTRGCPPVGGFRFAQPAMMAFGPQMAYGQAVEHLEWRTYPEHPDSVFLFRGTTQEGHYRISTGAYTPLLKGKTWGAAAAPPIPVSADILARKVPDQVPPKPPEKSDKPAPTPTAPDATRLPTGVDYEKMVGRRAFGYEINGRPVTADDAMAEIGGPRPSPDGVPNDASRPWIYTVGSEAFAKRVMKDLADPRCAPWRDLIRVQDMRNDDWTTKDRDGNQVVAANSLYFEPADGNMAGGWRVTEAEYHGPESIVEGLRKLKTPYDPSRDPGPHHPSPEPAADDTPWGAIIVGVLVAGIVGFIFLLIAIVGLVILARSRQPEPVLETVYVE